MKTASLFSFCIVLFIMVFFKPIKAQEELTITDIEFIETNPEVIPGVYTELFENSLHFRTKINFTDHESWQYVYVNIYHNGDLAASDGNITTYDATCTSVIVPGNDDPCGLITGLPPFTVPLIYGMNEIFAEAYIEGGQIITSEVIQINRLKPQITGHEFVEDVPGLSEGQVNIIYHDFIEFRLDLDYNDYLNYGDMVEVTAFLRDANGVILESHTSSSITQQGMTSIIVPDFSVPKFQFYLDPFYDQNLQLCFEAKFIREGLENPDIYSTCNNPVIIFHPSPQVTEVAFNEIIPYFEPGVQTNTFQPTVKFNTEIAYNDPLSVGEAIRVNVLKNGAEVDHYILETSQVGQTSIIIPPVGEYFEIPLDYEDVGMNEICFEAFFVEFPAVVVEPEDCLLINRVKPRVTDHEYVDDVPELIEGQVNTIFNDFIEFRLDLTYNDTYNYNDIIEATAYLKKNDGTVLSQVTKTNITQQGMTQIVIPNPPDIFHFDLDPYFDEPLELCFEAKFIREGLENPDVYSTCTDPVIIFHPSPQIMEAEFNEIIPAFEPGVLSNTFQPIVKFNAEINTNDPLSIGDTIRVNVLKNGIEVAHYIYEISQQGQTNIVIPPAGEYFEIPLDYEDLGVNEICFEAFFVAFPEVVVGSEACLLINRVKPRVINHEYVDDVPELIEGQVNTIFDDFIEFRLLLAYNDTYNYNDIIEATAYLKKNDGTILAQVIKTIITQQGMTQIVIPNPPDIFHFELDPYFDELLELCFEAKFVREGLLNPDVYSTCSDPVIIFHPSPQILEAEFYEIIPAFEPGVLSNTFQPTVKFNTEITYNDPFSVGDAIRVNVLKNGIEVAHYIYTTFQQGQTSVIIPPAGEYFEIPLVYEDAGVNEICFEAFFVDFPAVVVEPEDCLLINRIKPQIIAHEYVDDVPVLVEEQVNTINNDFIEFRIDLDYNDPWNFGDMVEVSAFLKDENGNVVAQQTISGITQQGITSIIVPDPSMPKFHFDLDPLYDQNLQLCFEAKFIRPDLESPDVYSTCDNPVIIVHHQPIVLTVDFENLEPGLIVGDPTANQEIFDNVIKYRAKVTYNDELSDEEKIFIQAIRIYKGMSTPILPVFELTQSGNTQIIIPAETLPKSEIPLDAGSGAYKIVLQAWFELNGTPGNVVTSDTLYLNHPVAAVHEITDHTQVLVYPTISTGKFEVKMNGSSNHAFDYSIFDVSGIPVIEKRPLHLINNHASIDLGQKPAGVYFLTIENKNSVITRKIILCR